MLSEPRRSRQFAIGLALTGVLLAAGAATIGGLFACVTGVKPEGGAGRIQREFRSLLESGVRIRPAGTARKSPERLLRSGYLPKQLGRRWS